MSPPTLTALANGLRVAHREVPGAMAAIYLWFDAGTADEGERERGAAHLLEHMLFKGTATRGVGEVAAHVEALGGDLNAYTTWDQTVLHATVLAEHWERALEVLADMAWSSALDPDELRREIPVVQEEIRGYDSDPDAVLEDALTARLFPGHAYGRPVLGTHDSVGGMDRVGLERFWRAHYTAGRCVLAVAGPMSEPDVIAAANRLNPPTGPARRALEVAPRPASGLERLDRDFETNLVGIGFRVPGDDHPDLAALDVLAAALGGGKASWLQAELRLERRVCADAWADLVTRRTEGTLEIGLAPQPEHTADALAGALELVERARTAGFTGPEVERAKQSLLADLTWDDETVDGVAHELAWFTSRAGHPSAREAWRRELAAVEPADVTAAARRWLVDPVVLVLDDPETPLPRLGERAPAPGPQGASAGQVLFSGPDDGWARQGPLASVYLGWPGGKLLEEPGTAGLVGGWASMVTSGTADVGAVELAAELDRLSASLHGIAGRNTHGLQLTAPAANLRPALEILAAVLLEPAFDAEDWDRERDELLLDLDTLADRPDEVLARRTWGLAFAGHPWGSSPTRTSLRAIGPRRLRAFHEARAGREGLVVAVAGEVERRATASALEALIAKLPAGIRVEPRPAPGPHPIGEHGSRAGHEQALVGWSARTPPLADGASNAALRLAAGVLSAQAGRLFLALRERDSLAYSVWARSWEGADGGLFGVGLATDPSQVARARRGLLAELDRLRADRVPEAELQRARDVSFGQHATGLQRASGRAATLALARLHGRPVGLDAERAELASVSADALRDAMASLPEGFVVAVRP